MAGTHDPPSATDRAHTGYLKVCELASGGIGRVELALRVEGRFRRLYAVKRLIDAHRDDDEFRAMFLDEARLAGLIRHPNVVSVLDVGEDGEGPFLVMDYVESMPASAVIAHAHETRKPVPLQACLRIAMDACEGLHAAHELREAGRPLGLVHRDVSPPNLLVGFDGVTRVTDFGIAKAFGRSTRTATGILKGKFGYMSPEQLRFEEPDRRSDLFSLGVVLFELLAGRRLYRNSSGMDGVRRILHEPPPDVGEVRDDVPPGLVELLFTLLAKEPRHRPPDARTVARTLESLLQELVLEEQRLEMSAFMEATFGKTREDRAQRILAGSEAAQRSLSSLHVAPAPVTRRRPVPRLFLAAGVLGVIAGVVLGSWFWARGGTAAATVVPPPPAASRGAPAPAAASSPPGPAPAPAAPAATGLPGSAAPPERAATPASRRHPVRKKATPAKEPAASGAGVPQWDWQ